MNVDPVAPGPCAQPPRPGAEQPDSRRVAEDFTALLVTQLVRSMWDTVAVDGKGVFDGAPGGDIYRGMVEGALADALTKGGLDALTDQVHRTLARTRAGGGDAEEGT